MKSLGLPAHSCVNVFLFDLLRFMWISYKMCEINKFTEFTEKHNKMFCKLDGYEYVFIMMSTDKIFD